MLRTTRGPVSRIVFRVSCLMVASLVLAFLPLLCYGTDGPHKKEMALLLDALQRRCTEYGWTDIRIQDIPWQSYRTSYLKRPLIFVQFGNPRSDCTLFLGGVHGDEIPTVYLMLKLAQHVRSNPAIFSDKCIVIAPLANPDGFFAAPPRRVNARGIDINRNFPTREWSVRALRDWERKYGSNKRYYPGRKGGSETETMFQMALIKRYRPRKILSVHSPLNAYDFDGPSSDLESFSRWVETISQETRHPFKRVGYYPGSLGNYASQERNIFTLTLELPTSDVAKAGEYFRQFQPAILKFLDLPLAMKPPFLRMSSYSKERGR